MRHLDFLTSKSPVASLHHLHHGLFFTLQFVEMSSTAYRQGSGDHVQVSSWQLCSSYPRSSMTLSHIFCTACSESLGLSASASNNRLCPACQTSLLNPDDAVLTKLNPTEDYKTSVLSGLTPATIMECAGRGLAFWSYQSTQEMCAHIGASRRIHAE